jgi:D-psicose/D-tagatose/L-ribulose 3-epimerase
MQKDLVGVHALVWVGGWSPAQCESALASTTAAGYDLIEIPAFDPASIDAVATREALERHGLAASISLGLDHQTDINSEDLDCVARGRETLLAALGLARDIGAIYLGGVIFGALDRYTAPTTDRARANSAAVIRELAQQARADDIRIGLEFVNRYESNLLNTTQQTLDYIDEVGEDNVFVHADVYHMNIEEQDFRSPVLACGDRLGYVHVGESHRGYLGTGTIDFPEFFGALRDVDYRGPVTFESFSSTVVDDNLTVRLAIWRNLWSDSTDLAVSARSFIAEGLGRERR